MSSLEKGLRGMTWGAEEEKKTLQHPKMPPWLSRWRDCLKQLEVEKKAEVQQGLQVKKKHQEMGSCSGLLEHCVR